MAKSVKNKSLLKAIGKAFNIKKKHIELKQNKNGSFQLNIKNLTAESLDKFALTERSEFTFIKLKPDHSNTITLGPIDVIEDTPSSNEPDMSELSVDNSLKVDLDIPTTTNVEEVTLPKSFEDIPLPCNCINCELNLMYNLLHSAQDNFKRCIDEQPMPKSQGPRNKRIIRKRKAVKLNRKSHHKMINSIRNNLATILAKHKDINAQLHPSNPNVQLTAKAKTVRYSTKNNKRVEFTIPSVCLGKQLSVESNLTEVTDEIIPPESSKDIELVQTNNATDPIMSALLPKENTSNCECIHCVIYPIVLKLRSANSQSRTIQGKIKSLQTELHKVAKSKRAEISRTIATFRKQKKVFSTSSNKLKQDIALKLSCYGDITQPHPTRSSVSSLKKANMISYLSKDEIRVQLTLVKKCDPV